MPCRRHLSGKQRFKKMIFNLKNRLTAPPKDCVLALGCFDGIHLGHQKIISAMRAFALRRNRKTALCLFHPHPLQILRPSAPFRRLFTLRETGYILKDRGLDFTGVIPFTDDFSRLSPEDFVRSFIVPRFKPSAVIAGYDFSFGRDRKGRLSHLKSFGRTVPFEVIRVPALSRSGAPVSTSRIKEALSLGDTKTAYKLLGRPFFFSAPVVKGRGRGGRLTFPTANLSLSPEKFLPKKGVYSARVWRSGRPRSAVLNIGRKPTFGAKENLTVEVHITGRPSPGNLYNQTLRVEPGAFLRPERPFKNPTALKAQIQKDVETALSRPFPFPEKLL